MTDFTLNPVWRTGVRQLETSDPVLAGPDGPDNIAPRQLSERTDFLKAALDHLFGQTHFEDGDLNPDSLVLPVSQGGTGLEEIGNGQFIRGNLNGGFSRITATQLIEQLNAIVHHSSIPTTNVGPVIYALGLGFLEWQKIGNWSGYASLMLGGFLFDTTHVPRGFTVAATGGNLNKATYPGLWAWAQNEGHVVGSAQWKKGEYKFVDVSSTQFKVPDIRDQFIRATGTDVDIANARTLGSAQGDALQNIAGTFDARAVGQTSEGGSDSLVPKATGAFTVGISAKTDHAIAYKSPASMQKNDLVTFNASRSARTSTETRGANTAFAPRIIAY